MVVSCHRQHRCCSRQDKGSGISVQAYGSAAPRSTRNNGDAGETLVDQQTGKGKEMRLEENSPTEAEAELLVPLSEAKAMATATERISGNHGILATSPRGVIRRVR